MNKGAGICICIYIYVCTCVYVPMLLYKLCDVDLEQELQDLGRSSRTEAHLEIHPRDTLQQHCLRDAGRYHLQPRRKSRRRDRLDFLHGPAGHASQGG